MTRPDTGILEAHVQPDWLDGIRQSSPSIDGLSDIFRDSQNGRLKKLFRSTSIPVSHNCRRVLWLRALQIEEKSITRDIYDSTVEQIYGKDLDSDIPTPKFVDPRYVRMFYLNNEGIKALKRVVRVLAFNKPYITYSPLLQPIASLCIHFHDEATSYAILDRITDGNYEYLTKTVKQWCAFCEVLVKLIGQYSFSIVKKLKQMGLLEKDHLFVQWASWIFVSLSFEELVAIMDCFFVEGLKIIMRCAMAVTFVHAGMDKLFKLQLLSLKSEKRRKTASCSAVNVADTQTEILQLGLSIRNLRRESIIGMLKERESNLNQSYHPVVTHGSVRLRSIAGKTQFPAQSRSIERVAALQDELGVENIGSNKAPTNILFNANFETPILKRSDLVRIWQRLPARVALYTPVLVFSTDRHGRRLQTLYDRIEFRDSFILLVRTLGKERLGVYASVPDASNWETVRASLRAGNSDFIGDGETFIFAFDTGDSFEIYRWAGNSNASNKRTDLFIKFDRTGLYVGGSGKHFALFVDNDLLSGSTGCSDTFNNSPLIFEQDRPVVHFKIDVVEAIAFEYIHS